MSGSQYENIRVLLAEPSSSFRNELRDLLAARGFKNIFATGNLSGVMQAVKGNEVDLLIGDTKMPEGDLSELIHQVRHGEIGHNPFIVTITLLSETKADVVRRVIDSGTDHVIAKPFNNTEIVEHIETLTHSRKDFVVTTDYIGPNRRAKPRPGTQDIPQFAVPNPLRSRMTGQISDASFQRSVEASMAVLNEQKVVRHAYQIGWLMNQIAGDSLDGVPDLNDESVVAHVERLRSVTSDIAQRIQKTRYAHVASMCMTLLNMSEDIMKKNFSAGDVQMISKLTSVIQSAFDENHTDMDRHRKRLAEEPQAEFDPSADPDWRVMPTKS
ncbi:response regulator [Magnetovibrio sp. PR-2]|uniref:response regulator n=1 Tax=Magnetovibrio sp. PR-2 TaxID=3120356 RepID=UPI002FCE0B22